MPTASIELRGTISGLPIGSMAIQPSAITMTAAIGERDLQNLAMGDNTITIPTGTEMVIITPPSGNATAIILKGAGGDTGRRLHNTRWNPISFDSSVTSFILNAAAGVNNVEFIFI